MWSSTSVLHPLQGVTCSAFRDALGGYLSYSKFELFSDISQRNAAHWVFSRFQIILCEP